MFGIALGPWGPFIAGAWSFFSSRLGIAALAFAVAWFWSGHKANSNWAARWQAKELALKNARAAEIARLQSATVEIARAATERVGEDQVLARALQAKIDAFTAKERMAKNGPQANAGCVADGAFVDSVREIDRTAGSRNAKSAGRAR